MNEHSSSTTKTFLKLFYVFHCRLINEKQTLRIKIKAQASGKKESNENGEKFTTHSYTSLYAVQKKFNFSEKFGVWYQCVDPIRFADFLVHCVGLSGDERLSM